MILDIPKLMRDLDSLLKPSMPDVDPSPLVRTAPPLRDSRKAEIQAALSELAAAMDAVARVQETLSDVQKELRRKAAVYHDALVSALRLPVEVLREIFLLAIDSTYGSDHDSVDLITRDSISLVSRYWRSVSLVYPELWTRIHAPWPLTETLKSDLATEMFRRSRNLPVQITTKFPAEGIIRNPLSPISDRLTSISLQGYTWNPHQLALLRQLAENETITSTTLPLIVDASRAWSGVISDVDPLQGVKNLVLLNTAINYDYPLDYQDYPIEDGPQMSCESLTVDKVSLDKAMRMLASLPAPGCQELILSRIDCTGFSQSEYHCVNYYSYYDGQPELVIWLRCERLVTFTIEYSNRLLELICRFWHLVCCEALTIRLEAARDSYRFEGYSGSMRELVLKMPKLSSIALSGRIDAINGLCQALNHVQDDELICPSLTHLRLELCESESEAEVWSLHGRVLHHRRRAQEMMRKMRPPSTHATNWDTDDGDDELDENMLSEAMKRPGYDDKEKKDWDEVGQHLSTLLLGRLGLPPMQHGRSCLKELEISRIFARSHVGLLKDFEKRGGKLTIL